MSPRRNNALNTTPEYSDAIYIYNQIVKDQTFNKEHAQIESDSLCRSKSNNSTCDKFESLPTLNSGVWLVSDLILSDAEVASGSESVLNDRSLSTESESVFVEKAKINWATLTITLGFFPKSQLPQRTSPKGSAWRCSAERKTFLSQESKWLCHSLVWREVYACSAFAQPHFK